MMVRLSACLALLFASSLFLPAQEETASSARRKPVPVEGKKTLPLRVLCRPFSHVYKDKDEASAKVRENVDAFQPFYVYTRPAVSDAGAAGWYEVGADNRGGVLGWMRAEDVMEWNQAMCLAYTHPEGRQPVMMFAKKDDLAAITSAVTDARTNRVNELYRAIDTGAIPPAFPVVSMEPRRSVFMFIEKQFYLMPILDHQAIELDGREGRILQMAAATAKERGATTLQDKEFRKEVIEETDGKSRELKDLKIDIVYAIDMTASMQPYIDATRAAVKEVSEALAAEPGLSERVRFGLWGFRDSMDIPGIEFNTRNFTPELQNAADFLQTISSVQEAKVGSKGYEEDMFSGVDDAMRKTAWGQDTLRFVVLIGDAPAHVLGEKWNSSGQDDQTLRQFADDNRISLYSIFIRNKEVVNLHELGESQFKALARNRGITDEADLPFRSVDGEKREEFSAASIALVSTFKQLAGQAQKGDVTEILSEKPSDAPPASSAAATRPAEVPAPAPAQPAAGSDPFTDPPPGMEVVAAQVESSARSMVRAALVDWLGEQESVAAPRDVQAWVADKDLLDPAVQSLEVRVLINKNQLDSLRTVLMEIMAAGRRGQVAGEDFFEALQSTSATLSVTPEQIKNARTLAQTGLIPEFLTDLPYKSRIMSINNEVWAGWSQDQQDEFLREVDAKISLYKALHDNPEGWVRLNEGDDADEFVHPVLLESLP